MSRIRRLYRVVVLTAPEEEVPRLYKDSDGRWVEEDWLPPFGPEDGPPVVSFVVGQARTYQSRSGAKACAERWVAHGATVRIDVSDPVTWPGGE